jgi:hypothetical protein
MNNVLLIDDDLDFKNTFAMEAQAYSIGVAHQRSFDGLRRHMPAQQRTFVAIVLDIKCLITEEQPKEDVGFIGTALKYLDTNCPGFPRIILTGDDDAFERFSTYNPDESIFQKTPDGLAAAFQKLRYFGDNSEDLRIKREHSLVFSLFARGCFDHHAEATLLNVLRSDKERQFPHFGAILRDIRALQETIYKTINKRNKIVVPDQMIRQNGMIKFGELMKHLSGFPSAPGQLPVATVFHNSAIENISKSLYWTSGRYIHADPNEFYFISHYALDALRSSLMELFVWSEQYL